MSSELKPCPFCGGEAKFVHIFENPEKCMVSCRECDGGIDAVFANEEAAAEAWNRRARPANLAKECPAMERVEGGIPYCSDKQAACDGCPARQRAADAGAVAGDGMV